MCVYASVSVLGRTSMSISRLTALTCSESTHNRFRAKGRPDLASTAINTYPKPPAQPEHTHMTHGEHLIED